MVYIVTLILLLNNTKLLINLCTRCFVNINNLSYHCDDDIITTHINNYYNNYNDDKLDDKIKHS